MKVTIRIEVPDSVDFESVREYLHETLVEFQTDTAKEFEVQPEQIKFDFDFEE